MAEAEANKLQSSKEESSPCQPPGQQATGRGNSKSKHSLLPPTISCQELPWLDQFPEDEEGLALVQFREVSLPGHRAGGKDGKCWRQALSNPTRFILTQLTAARTGFSGPSFQRDTWFPEEVTLLPTQE